MENICIKENIPIVLDECEEELRYFEIFKTQFGENLSGITTTSLAPQGSTDTTINAILEKKFKNYLLVTGDKQYVKKFFIFPTNIASFTYNQESLAICFSNNTYNSEEKRSILSRLLKTKGFKFKDIHDLLKRYVAIFVSKNEARCFLRKNNTWKIIPLYKEYAYNF
jgi:hypothetical protein